MKKRYLLISIILGVFVLFSTACSCSGNETIYVDENGNIYATYKLDDLEKEQLIYGFNELKDFQEINATEAFGITKPNYDTRYVSEGNGSMEVRVDGYERLLHFPEPTSDTKQCIFLYPRLFFKDTDFLDASAFRLDVYNDNYKAQQITLKVIGKENSIIFEPQIVLPNTWTTCNFKVDTNKSYYFGLGDVSEIAIVFENRAYGVEPKHYYIDNFRYVKQDVKSGRLEVPTFDGNMICDYEDSYFYNTSVNIAQSAPQGIVYNRPKIEWNDNKEFVKSGDKSLKITRYPDLKQRSMLGGYYDVTIVNSQYLQTIDFTKYDVNDYVIKMDIYLDYSDVIDVNVSMASATVASNEYVVLKPGWNEVVYGMNRTDLDWGAVSYCNLLMPEYYDSENAVMYVDNIRIEKITVS